MRFGWDRPPLIAWSIRGRQNSRNRAILLDPIHFADGLESLVSTGQRLEVQGQVEAVEGVFAPIINVKSRTSWARLSDVLTSDLIWSTRQEAISRRHAVASSSAIMVGR